MYREVEYSESKRVKELQQESGYGRRTESPHEGNLKRFDGMSS